MGKESTLQVAVIGAGLAGSSCARALADAGLSVHVFDKSRGVGGRLATRRLQWVGQQGRGHSLEIDHGAVGFEAQSLAFQAFSERLVESGVVARWSPKLAPEGLPSAAEQAPMYLPVPNSPALCRHLLKGLDLTLACTVDSLHRTASGWLVQAGGAVHPASFDAVVLALPPAQSAALLGAHRADWARHASVVPMAPCWTLMGVADEPEPASNPALEWQAARPASGPLAWVIRNESRPGRISVPGQSHWVAHARAAWSRQHLEQSAAWVQAEMQEALEQCLGQSLRWQHVQMQRWRYALPQPNRSVPTANSWWDGDLGLGLCGDFLGGAGAEGAWLSAQSLSAALIGKLGRLAEHPVSRVVRPGAEPVPGTGSVHAAQSV